MIDFMLRPFRSTGASRAAACYVVVAALAASCRDAERTYTVSGQVVAMDASRRELMIAHDSIPSYMGAMVMPFKVNDASIAKLEPGDLVRGRLVVREDDGFLDQVERIGHREVPAALRALPATMDDFLSEGDVLPDLAFVDQDGASRRLRGDADAAVVLTFIYTRCPFPTFCPLTDRHFQNIQQRVQANRDLADRVRLLSITIDPEYDTTAVLKSHADRLGADARMWSFVRPDGQTAAALPLRFGVPVTRESDNAIIVHSLATVVIEPDGTIAKIYRGNEWTPADVITSLESAIRRNGGGDGA
jgi:protein SCO1/2